MDIIYFAELPSSTATEEVYVPIGQIKLYIAIKNTIGSAPVNLTVHESNGNNLERNRVTENSVWEARFFICIWYTPKIDSMLIRKWYRCTGRWSLARCERYIYDLRSCSAEGTAL